MQPRVVVGLMCAYVVVAVLLMSTLILFVLHSDFRGYLHEFGLLGFFFFVFFFSSRRRHTRCGREWSSDVCSSDLTADGWWPEICEHGVNGWQIGDGNEEKHYNGSYSERIKKQDADDLKALYDILLNQVIPLYYNQPEKWVQMMQASIESTIEKYSATRMLEDYYQQMYGLEEYYTIEDASPEGNNLNFLKEESAPF